MTTTSNVRSYTVRARSSGTFGRVVANARNHHVIVDGPVENGCPGEALTPGELFLAGIASCGVELIEVAARRDQVPLRGVETEIQGTIDPANRVREDLMVFNAVRLHFRLSGVTDEQARSLVEAFKGR